MYPKIDERNIKNPPKSPIRILLADSDTEKIEKIITIAKEHCEPSIRVCNNYLDLKSMLKAEPPELLLLGTFGMLNYFDICYECRQMSKELPIIMLSRHSTIDDYFYYFRQFLLTKGATDVIAHDLLQLERVFQGLPQPVVLLESQKAVIVMEKVLMAIREITEIASNYFGALAQGNYWRKSHARIVADFPNLQNWSADHFGIISCDESILQTQITDKDLLSLQKWVSAYLSECQRIITDFRAILINSNLSPIALQLMLDPSPP